MIFFLFEIKILLLINFMPVYNRQSVYTLFMEKYRENDREQMVPPQSAATDWSRVER